MYNYVCFWFCKSEKKILNYILFIWAQSDHLSNTKLNVDCSNSFQHPIHRSFINPYPINLITAIIHLTVFFVISDKRISGITCSYFILIIMTFTIVDSFKFMALRFIGVKIASAEEDVCTFDMYTHRYIYEQTKLNSYFWIQKFNLM